MTRLRLALTLVCLLTWMTGCRMCSSTFDYCGPTASSPCGEACGLCTPRAGSILTGASQAAVAEEVMVEPEMLPPDQLSRSDFDAPIMPRQIVQGEEIEGVILSVEDRKLEDISEPQQLDISTAERAPMPATENGNWTKKR